MTCRSETSFQRGCRLRSDTSVEAQGLLNQTQNVVDNLNPIQQVHNVQDQVDGLFQQQCGPIAPGQGFLPGGQLPHTQWRAATTPASCFNPPVLRLKIKSVGMDCSL